MAKRRREEAQSNPQLRSAASEFNRRILRKIQNALSADPEIDLLSVFPMQYSARLSTMLTQKPAGAREDTTVSEPNVTDEKSTEFEKGIVDTTSLDEIASVVFPLSDSVQEILEISTSVEQCPRHTARAIHNLTKRSPTIWQSQACRKHAVFRCNNNVIVKVVPDLKDYTEYTSMQYLWEHAPDIPAPRPLGLVDLNATSYIFMSFVPGLTLDKVWPMLTQERKISLGDQLNDLLLDLKKLQRPDWMPLGGVGGEGCKDTRRQVRICKESLTTAAEFEDFLFSDPHFGGPVYIAFLRRFLSSREAAIIFSHGDLRPENIIVQPSDDVGYTISGILDWEKSGFYPDYFECIKATSNMSTSETDDWYMYLPMCASPATYHAAWLVDRLWDSHVA